MPGCDTIYMEEPEFWARAGYSDAFKEEWQAYYGFPWACTARVAGEYLPR